MDSHRLPEGFRRGAESIRPGGGEKKGGQYFTPKSIVSLIVEMIEPYQGRVYDPAMGSGGFFVQSERFIEEHGGTIGNIMVFGQESNPTTWRLTAMNMAIRGIDFDFGKEPADTFTRDQHPDLRADFVMALPSAAARSLPRSHPADRPTGRINPPFNIKEWWDGKLEGDARWKYGTPPQGNANFAWVQHNAVSLGTGRGPAPGAPPSGAPTSPSAWRMRKPMRKP